MCAPTLSRVRSVGSPNGSVSYTHLKAELIAALAQALDVSPHALDVPDIDSYIGLMHTLFTLEDLYGLTVSESDGEICLKVDTSKGKDAHELRKMLYAWKEQANKLSSEEISKDKYDEWRYHYQMCIRDRCIGTCLRTNCRFRHK